MMGEEPTIVWTYGGHHRRVCGEDIRGDHVKSAEEEGFVAAINIRHRDAIGAARKLCPNILWPCRIDVLAAELGWSESRTAEVVSGLRETGRWPWPKAPTHYKPTEPQQIVLEAARLLARPGSLLSQAALAQAAGYSLTRTHRVVQELRAAGAWLWRPYSAGRPRKSA